MTNALIFGLTGQDGAYLAKFLLEKNYQVFGAYRRLSTPNFWRLHHLDVHDKIDFVSFDLLDSKIPPCAYIMHFLQIRSLPLLLKLLNSDCLALRR